MELLLFVLGGGLIICLVFLAITHTKKKGFEERVSQMSAALDTDVQQVREELEREREKASEVQEKVTQWVEEKTEATTKFLEAEAHVKSLINERDIAYRKRDEAIKIQTEAEKQAALRAQEVKDMKLRMEDWETAKFQSLEAAKAATLETATRVSSKLLADHKRESDAAKKETDGLVEKTTRNLFKEFTNVVNTVSALNKSVDENKEKMEAVWQSLSSPGGSGQFAEMGLENTLNAFGFKKGRDFVMQQQIDGRKLRPDAMVFLPGETLLVIDSKASKFFLELQTAKKLGAETDAEKKALENLSKTMIQHLRNLSSKNYKSEVLAGYRESGHDGKPKQVMSIMYLPKDSAIEKVEQADSNFLNKAIAADIHLAGPASLASLIGFSRLKIEIGRQAENQEKIIHGTQALLDTIGVVVGHTVGVGKGLKTATKKYGELARSMNTRLLPKVRSVASLGVRSSRSKSIPKSVPVYEVVDLELGGLIEGEVEEVPEQPALEDQSITEDDD